MQYQLRWMVIHLMQEVQVPGLFIKNLREWRILLLLIFMIPKLMLMDWFRDLQIFISLNGHIPLVFVKSRIS
ncbi:MAG: hypothetical protein DRI37_08570 [Chloroflexi bacterium]|nr:MAG: hypothetical protein DRI37_08570 [Chloroflexota bacterium]